MNEDDRHKAMLRGMKLTTNELIDALVEAQRERDQLRAQLTELTEGRLSASEGAKLGRVISAMRACLPTTMRHRLVTVLATAVDARNVYRTSSFFTDEVNTPLDDALGALDTAMSRLLEDTT